MTVRNVPIANAVWAREVTEYEPGLTEERNLLFT
jgi:hypothetical protein